MSLSTVATDLSTDTKVTLSVTDDDRLIIESSSNSQQSIISLDFIYGVTSTTVETSHEFSIHYLEVTQPNTDAKNSGTKTITDFRSAGLSKWTRHTHTFRQLSDTDPSFSAQLQARAVPAPPGQVHAFVNPAAGNRQASTHWRETVEPMLIAAGYPTVDVIETKPGGKARDQAEALGRQWASSSNSDNDRNDVIVLGGDGTVHQIVNGLSDAYDHGTPTIRLGIVPSGSGNAFSLSLEIQSIEQATLKIIKRQTQPFRLIHVEFPDKQVNEKKLRILVVMSWGFHAQLVSKARYLRWFMGNERFSWVALWLLTFLRHHAGELTLRQNVRRYDRDTKQFQQQQEGDEVVIRDDKFTYFLAAKQASLERGFPIVPFASPATDDMDVVIMRNVTKERLKEATIKVLEGGLHVNEPCVEYYKTSELVLQVREQAEICLDGEIYTLPSNGTLRLELIRPAEGEPNFETFV